MAVVNGTWTSSDRQDIFLKIAQLGSDDSIMRTYYNVDNGVHAALREFQVNAVQAAEVPGNRDAVVVHWLEQVEQSTAAIGTTCSFTGAEAGTESQTYTVSGGQQYPFSVVQETFESSIYSAEEAIARMFLTADKALSEWVETQDIAYLNGNITDMSAAAASYTFPGQTASNGTGVSVSAANVTSDFIGNMIVGATLLDYGNYFIMGGPDQFLAEWRARLESGTQADLGQGNKLSAAHIRTNIKNFVTDSDHPFYVVSSSGYAIANKTRFVGEQHVVGDSVKYTINSQINPDITYEVYERTECSTMGYWTKHFNVVVRYDVFANPISVNAPTGSDHNIKFKVV